MQNDDQEPGQEEEAPQEEFDEFVAEADKQSGGGGKDRKDKNRDKRDSTGQRPSWDTNDPLYNDRDRSLNMVYWLRQSQTVTRMLFAYGFMDLDNVEIAIKNIRRLVPVHPPKFFLDTLSWDRRFLEVVVPAETLGIVLPEDLPEQVLGEKKYPVRFEIFGEHNQNAELVEVEDEEVEESEQSAVENNGEAAAEPKKKKIKFVLPKGSLPKEFAKDGNTLGFIPQGWWVFCGAKSEANARKPTGLLQMPYDEVKAGVGKKLRARFGQRRRPISTTDLREQIDTILDIRAARRQVSGLYVLDPGQTLKVTGYCEHRKCWEAFNSKQHLIQFNTNERYEHMRLAKGLAELLLDPREPDTTEPFTNTQKIKESIAAEEALLDMVSTVLRKPLLAIYPPEDGDRFQVRVLHVEVVVFASEDEFNDLSKTNKHRKKWLGLERAKALAQVGPGDVTKLPNEWYLASADPTVLQDITFPSLVDPASHLGYVWELAQEWARRTGNDPLDYKLPAAPEIGGWHLREIHAMSESFNTLLYMAEVVREGGAITDKDLREKYLPKLVQYEPEVRPGVPSVIWTYWEGDPPKIPHTFEEWQTAGRPEKWVPHAAPYRDIALWYDWWWVMALDQYVYPELVEYVNRQFREAGLVDAEDELTVRVTADEPSSNYFRHHDIAREIWRNQPKQPLEERFRRELRTSEDMGIWELRNSIYKQFGGLPIIHDDRHEDDLLRLLHELLFLADNRVDDLVTLMAHGADGSARGFDFGTAGSIIKSGYGQGYGTAKEQQEYIVGLYEVALKCRYYDTIRGVVEAAHFDPDLLADSGKLMGLITGAILPRKINFDYGKELAKALSKMSGPTQLNLPYPRTNAKEVGELERDFVTNEIKRLLTGARVQRILDGRLIGGRWIQLSSGLYTRT